MPKRDATLVTARAVLHPFADADTDELLTVFREPMVRRYLLDDEVVSADWVRAEIEASGQRFERDGTGLWAIRLAGRPDIIGFAGFREFFDPPQLQLLYGLLPQFCGLGLATEAAAAVCNHAFHSLGLERVAAATDADNEASRRVLLRLGMRLERTTPVGIGGTTFYVLEGPVASLAASTRISRRVNAPRARVYDALLDARAVATWMVPDGMTIQVHAFDAREGGPFRISLTYDEPTAAGKTTAHTDTYHGRFVRLVPNEQVEQVVEFETADPAMRGEMTITFTLADANGGTDVIAVHDRLPPGLSPADNETGWRMSLDKLAALVEGHHDTRDPARA